MFVTRFILSTNTCRTFICLYYLMLNTIWPTWGREKQLMKQKHYKLLKIKWQLRNNVQQAKKKNNIYCKVLQYQPLVDTQSRHREHNTLKICGAVYKTSSHHFWIYSQKWPSEMESKTITHSTTNWIMWSWKMILLTLVVPFLFTVFVFCFFADLPFCTSGSSDAVGSGTITQSKHKGYETAMCRKLWGQCDTCMHVSILLFYGGKCSQRHMQALFWVVHYRKICGAFSGGKSHLWVVQTVVLVPFWREGTKTWTPFGHPRNVRNLRMTDLCKIFVNLWNFILYLCTTV